MITSNFVHTEKESNRRIPALIGFEPSPLYLSAEHLKRLAGPVGGTIYYLRECIRCGRSTSHPYLVHRGEGRGEAPNKRLTAHAT